MSRSLVLCPCSMLFTSSLHASAESKDDDWSLKTHDWRRSVHATISLTIHRMAFVGCCRLRRAGHRSTGDRRKTAVFLFHGSNGGKCHCRANNALSFIPSRLTHLSATSTTAGKHNSIANSIAKIRQHVLRHSVDINRVTLLTSGEEVFVTPDVCLFVCFFLIVCFFVNFT